MVRFRNGVTPIGQGRGGRAEGDIVNCESVLSKMGSLSVSPYSPPFYEGNSLCPPGTLQKGSGEWRVASEDGVASGT